MKANTVSIWASGALMCVLTACEHQVAMETTVYPDGELDKQITLQVDETVKNPDREFNRYIDSTQFISWNRVDSARSFQLKPTEGKKYITYRRHFGSASEANQHLAAPNDTLFQVTSSFEKKFRWFFTYITYSDTYHAINRLDYPTTDFFTPEDFQFINRLPAEGKAITPADSLYLKQLNEKITDHYGNRAFFEAYFSLLLEQVNKRLPNSDHGKKLMAAKEPLYQIVLTDKDIEEDFIQFFADSLQIPLRLDSFPDYVLAKNNLERKINFISTAYDGKFTHAIHMPWTIVNTNADSVSGNSAYWAPPAVKFLLHDYRLSVEARKTNYWAISLSVMVMIGVGWLLRRGA
ncbi:MAG: hypothetical protein KF763_08375 [Cyclobacteriaceae bacterium]|nr:hypothetical protein [Cyclobacteriaceae bacterium]